MKIVLLPGLDGTGVHFQPFLRELPHRWEARVIRYPTALPQDYTTLTDFVAQQLPTAEPFCLLAESFSGPIAYALAASERFPLAAVIFVATFLRPPQPTLLWLRQYLPLRWFLNLRVPNWVLRRSMLDVQTSDEFLSSFWNVTNEIGTEVILQRFATVAALASVQKKVNPPCLYLQASHDLLVPKRSVEDFKRVCPNLQVIQIPGRHFLLQSVPKPCVAAIERWMEDLTKFEAKPL